MFGHSFCKYATVCLSIQPLMVSVSAALYRMQCFESVTLQTPLTCLQDT